MSDGNKRDSQKLSFQLATPNPKRRKVGGLKGTLFEDEDVEEVDKSERILSISGKGIQSLHKKEEEKPLVIPLPKDLNAGKLGIKRDQGHLMLARIARGEDVDMEDAKSEESDTFDGEIIQNIEGEIDKDLPLLLRNRRLDLEEIVDEDEKFRKDVESRPDVATLDDYARTPIEKFGEALLRGMDWKPGMRIGMNGRGLVKPIEFVPRPRGLGLGADPSKQKDKRKRKSEKGKEVMVVAPDEDGKQRHYRTVDEKLVSSDYKKKQYRVGAQVIISGGPHEGISGQIEDVLDYDRFYIRFSSGESEVVPLKHLSLKESQSNESSRKFSSRDSDSRVSKKYERESSSSDRCKDSRKSESKRKREKEREKQETWMRPGISVRIVSKSFEKGKYYCKRVQIIDVVSNKQCTVTVDGKVVENVRERMIETALPKPGGRVIILRGSNKGRIGSLQSRNSKYNEAVVQHDDDLSIGTYRFEDVAQYSDINE